MQMENNNYNWVSLGCGVIANELAQAMEKEGRTLYGVANRTYNNAVAFAKKYNIPNVYKNIDDAINDENVDIIYISTPHNTHIKYLIKALEKGKHVLCEKNITLIIDELEAAKKIASDNGVVLAEAMTIYHMPIYKQLDELIKRGVLGELRILQMNAFCVVSDSGTLPEESSFFTSVGNPFPAVCIRTSTKRPEAHDKACFIQAGIDEKSHLQAVTTAVDMNENQDYGIPVPTYVEENVSTKVVKIIQSYTGVVNKMVWRKS